MKSAQGDIVAIADVAGIVVANYTYDSWGKLVSISDTSGCNIGEINPLRYRGYYYDSETGLYYLNARYYDPKTGRFLNADDNLEGGLNLYCYCGNNPVNFSDYDGKNPIEWAQKGALYLDGSTYLAMKGCPTAADFYKWTIYGKEEKPTKLMENILVAALENSAHLKNEIKNKYIPKDARATKFDTVESSINFTADDDLNLHYTVGAAYLWVSGVKAGDMWRVKVKLKDRYDFDEVRKAVNASNRANNLGLAMQDARLIDPFDTEVEFTILI